MEREHSMKHYNKFYWLDLLRGIAALAVFSGHLRIICFKDIPVQELPFFGKLVFFFTGFGHQAVMIFFVLSGFFIIKSIHELEIKKRWNFTDYGINRLTRLWTVLLPALVIGFMLDKLGLALFPDSLSYSNQLRYFTGSIQDRLHPSVLIGNIFFLQTMAVPPLGSNGPLWSLPYEFWYYVVFPLLYFSASRRYTALTRLIFALTGLTILVLVSQEIALFFIIWLMGGLSYVLFKTKNQALFSHRLFLVAVASVLMIALVMIRFKRVPLLFNDYTLGFIFALLIPPLTKVTMSSTVLRRLSSFFSDISYTLYLVHLPFNFLITSCFYFQAKSWGATNFVIFLGLAFLSILYATLIWYLFERNTAIIKKGVVTLFGRSKSDRQKVYTH
jgi:peptidoglycan/LPS O-acetylase OafA/YrhL